MELSWWAHFDLDIASDFVAPRIKSDGYFMWLPDISGNHIKLLSKIFVWKRVLIKKYDVYWYLIKQIHPPLLPASALVK